jgi:hypothetical protein
MIFTIWIKWNKKLDSNLNHTYVEKRCDGGVGVTKLIGPVESRWFAKLEGICKVFQDRGWLGNDLGTYRNSTVGWFPNGSTAWYQHVEWLSLNPTPSHNSHWNYQRIPWDHRNKKQNVVFIKCLPMHKKYQCCEVEANFLSEATRI